MSAIRSALDEMIGVSDEQLSTEQLAADIGELAFARQQVDVLIARKTRNMADRGGHHQLGHPSPTAMLASLGRMSTGLAKHVVSRGQAIEKAPTAHAAWADGRISTDQADLLFRAAEGVPDAYPGAEERLVAITEGLSVSDTARALEYWRQSVDGPGDIDLATQLERRGLSLSKTTGGMRRVDGWLTQTAGEAFEAALRALMPPPADGDTRTPRQRRHDALEDLARDWLDHANPPSVTGEKPHLVMLTDFAALEGHAGGTHETFYGGAIVDIDTLRMLACDCSITRIFLDGDSEVLDVGRKTRVWTSAQRKAIIARDRHCQAAGCERPANWCDIHTVEHLGNGYRRRRRRTKG
ncbi:MAG TPA: DUF222 domain-containing protein [Acidimicrobiia bacterium]|jgi:hypothetical protein|nr:DUF222 domain-containing protein [Acidimicrobiia bacterium]